MSPEGLLEAGLLPVGEPARGADPIRPRRYAHPRLGDRPVVRLVGDTVGPGEDQALAFLGFGPPEVAAPVAQGRPRSLGYPAWALVNDPDGARVALDAVPDLERAARLARSKPGRALELLEALAVRLPTGHLPSFWEQAGRIYVAAGNTRQAAAMFGRARQAEQMYALPVDEETRRAAYLEFAFAGALTVKALAAYADELQARYEPDRVYTEFRELVLRRARGGLPPWAELPARLRTLAKAAGLDPAAERDALIEQVMRLPAARQLSYRLWEAWRAPLTTLATASPELRTALLTLFPDAEEVRPWWFGFLAEIGALDALVAGTAPIRTADWVSRAVRYVRQLPDARRELIGHLERMRDRLVADAVPVKLGAGAYWYQIDAELLDACLAWEIPLAELGEHESIELPGGPGVRDLATLAADRRLGPRVDAAIESTAGRSGLAGLLAFPALRPRIERLLDARIRAVGESGLAGSHEAANKVGRITGRAVLETLPDQRAALAAADLAAPLARTLRAGILDELGWPALDEAVARLGGTEELTMSVSWPVLTLCSRTTVIAVGPDGPVAEHDLKLTGQIRIGPFAAYAGGVFRIEWWGDKGPCCYWSDAPSTTLSSSSWRRGERYGKGFSLLTPDGLIGHGGLLRPGDAEWDGPGDTLFDGATYWRYQRSGFQEFDPVTGTDGRFSVPAFFEDRPLAAGETWSPVGSSLAVLPDGLTGSPLGQDGGLVGFRVGLLPGDGDAEFRIEGVDGRSARGVVRRHSGDVPWGLIRFPGAERDRLVRNTSPVSLADTDGSALHWRVEVGPLRTPRYVRPRNAFGERPAGTPLVPPPAFWHFLRPRDEAGSKRLRALADETARALLDAGLVASKTKDEKAFRTELTRLLPEITDEALLAGVAQAVMMAVATEQKRATLLAPEPQRIPRPRGDDAEAITALHDLIEGYGGYARNLLLQQIAHAGALLTGDVGLDTAAQLPSSSYDWTPLIGRIGAVAVRAVSTATDSTDRAALIAFLELWSGTPFCDPDRLLTGKSDTTEVAAKGVVAVTEPQAHVMGMERRRCFVALRTGESLGTVTETARPPAGWGSADQLRRLLELLAEKGPVPWDPQAADDFAATTGVGRAASALILAGFAGPSRWQRGRQTVLADIRTALDLKAKETETAREQLTKLRAVERLDVLADALPPDPADLWEPEGLRRMAERAAAGWVARFGRRVIIPETTLALADRLPAQMTAADVCTLFTEPAAYPALTATSGMHLAGEGYTVALEPGPDARFLSQLVRVLAQGIGWAYAELPTGDPVRDGIPAALDLVRTRLANPGVLLPAGMTYAGPEDTRRLKAVFGPDPYRGPAKLDSEATDDGLTIVAGDYGAAFFFRPSRYGTDERSKLLESVVTDAMPALVRLLRGDGYTGIAERIRSGGLQDGAYEADPSVSAPDLVAQVGGTLGVGPDSATLYLQLLALLEPTDRNIKLWNGWTAARHKKALAPLLDRDLLVAGKRPRAGRTVFLPGGWMEAKAPNLPVEGWKTEMYGLRLADGGRRLVGPLPKFGPLRPLPELFETAWQRVQNGDAPR